MMKDNTKICYLQQPFKNLNIYEIETKDSICYFGMHLHLLNLLRFTWAHCSSLYRQNYPLHTRMDHSKTTEETSAKKKKKEIKKKTGLASIPKSNEFGFFFLDRSKADLYFAT